MKINKIRPKFHFLTKKTEQQMTHLFFFSIYSFFAPTAIWKTFNRLFSTQKRKRFISIFSQKFSYILLLIQNLLDEQFVTTPHRAWATCVVGSC